MINSLIVVAKVFSNILAKIIIIFAIFQDRNLKITLANNSVKF